MDHIDEFESLFKRAQREQYQYMDVEIKSVTFINDTDREEALSIQRSIEKCFPCFDEGQVWHHLCADDYSNVDEMLEALQRAQTDMVITYRHLNEQSIIPQHSLGVYLDVLTQVSTVPVMVLPGTSLNPVSLDNRKCAHVMVVADHILGDANLINYGVSMLRDQGELWMCHVEDDVVFDRYIRAIGRIPEIDTDEAKTLIASQLSKEAIDYMETCERELEKKKPRLNVESTVAMGHVLSLYQSLIIDHEIDLLVMNTKDEGQLAMHGTAYSLSVELEEIPLLLL
ncbi:MAG: hypothetical protein MK103_15485 [Planctomycetes bacterium]|nr:hypothetical protein [Planctomycetota bacterium]